MSTCSALCCYRSSATRRVLVRLVDDSFGGGRARLTRSLTRMAQRDVDARVAWSSTPRRRDGASLLDVFRMLARCTREPFQVVQCSAIIRAQLSASGCLPPLPM